MKTHALKSLIRERQRFYQRWLRIIETVHGRKCDWFIKYKGREVAVLTDVEDGEMFWFSYKITLLTTDDEINANLFSQTFWDSIAIDNVEYVNKEFGLVRSRVMVTPEQELGRLFLRGLNIQTPDPSWFDKLMMKLLKKYGPLIPEDSEDPTGSA